MKNPAFFFTLPPSDFNPVSFSLTEDNSSPTGQSITHFPMGGQMDGCGLIQFHRFRHERLQVTG